MRDQTGIYEPDPAPAPSRPKKRRNSLKARAQTRAGIFRLVVSLRQQGFKDKAEIAAAVVAHNAKYGHPFNDREIVRMSQQAAGWFRRDRDIPVTLPPPPRREISAHKHGRA
jgi:hypothetical protein